MQQYQQKLSIAFNEHNNNGDYNHIKALYKKLTEEYPEKADSYYCLGVLEAEQGNIKEAIKAMHNLVEKFPSIDKGYVYLAKLYLIEKDMKNALNYLKLALIYNHKDIECLEILHKVFPKESGFLKKYTLNINDNFISIKEYQKCKYKMIYPSETIERKPPKYLDELLTAKQRNLLNEAVEKYKISKCVESYVIEIPNGRVLINQGDQTYIITEEGQCIKEMLEPEGREINITNIPPEIEVANKMLVLSSSYGGNYYHWLTWTIPRLKMIEKAGYRLEDFDKIIINTVGFKFQRNLIKLLNIPHHKIIGTQPKGALLKAKTLVTATLPNYLQTQKFVTDSITERFLKSEYYSEDSPKLVYLSRNRGGSRRVLNEKELLNYLSQMGFITVYAEELDIEQQAKIFANADIIIAPHGAGLVNLSFSRPNIKVIEIFNEQLRDSVDTGFFRICSNMNIDHYIMFAESINGENLDMVVDLVKLEKTIEMVIKDWQNKS
jgi:hypothetical protein